MKFDVCIFEALSYTNGTMETVFVGVAINYHYANTVEPPLTDIVYSGHLIIQDKMLRSRLNLHYA